MKLNIIPLYTFVIHKLKATQEWGKLHKQTPLMNGVRSNHRKV